MTNTTWIFDPSQLTDGDNVLTVVVDPTGQFASHNYSHNKSRLMLSHRSRGGL